MTIQAGALLTDPERFLPTSGVDKTVSEPEKRPGTHDSRPGASDRLQFSAAALRKIFGKRFARILQAAAERPEKQAERAAKELAKEFHNAIKALKRAGVLDKSEAKALRKAYRGALDRLKELPEADAPARIESSRQARVRESQSYSLEVRTAEGDLVTIRLERSDLQAYSERFATEGGRTSYSSQYVSASSSSLSFRVEGELNEEERAAIEELVGRVDQLATRFFDGDTQAALEYGLELGLEARDPEIAGFAVELGYSVEAYAARSYSAVQSLAPPEAEAEAEADVAPDLAPATDLAGQLRELGSQAQLETLFADARSLVQSFFRGAVESDPRFAATHDTNALLERLGRLLQAV